VDAALDFGRQHRIVRPRVLSCRGGRESSATAVGRAGGGREELSSQRSMGSRRRRKGEEKNIRVITTHKVIMDKAARHSVRQTDVYADAADSGQREGLESTECQGW
jgi:hypothetical protein